MTTNWQLTELYKESSDPKIEADFQHAQTKIETLKNYRNKIAGLSSKELLKLLTDWEETAIILEKIGLFAGLLESTNVGVDAVTRFNKQVEERTITLGKELIFIEIELAAIDDARWQEHLNAPELQPYHKFLEKVYRQAQYTLTEAEEKILAEKSQTSWHALTHLYSITTDTLPIDWEGKSVTLEELLNKFHDAEPAIRKQAAMVLHTSLAKNDRTTPAILNSLIQDKKISDGLRHYDYPEQARLMGDDVEKETVQALIKAVNGSYQLVTDYYELKKKILGVEELYWWDRYAPLPETKATIEQAEAQRMVIDAYQQFSPEMATIAQEMIDTGHIDWLPSPTKRGGAFCAYGSKGTYPYVLLNYVASPRDVMTVAHELGHAIHDVLADRENRYFQTHPSLALAEIASVFGETLLFEKLVNGNLAKNDKISLLMSFVEDRFATVFRQITMFQFEQQLHAKRRTEGELSKEAIDTLWHETMQAPFAKALTYTDEHKNSWMYVHHLFHWPFYVYSYSFAQLCVLALYRQYKEQGQAFVPKYLEILKAGGSLSPKDNLARAGLDLADPNFWKDGLSVINQSIDQLRALV